MSDNLMKGHDGHPDDPAWSAPAAAMDTLMLRAAFYGLRHDHKRRQDCIDAANAIATVGGWHLAVSIETQVRWREEWAMKKVLRERERASVH